MGAQVKVFLSSDERRELLKLGYKPDEVDTMRVEIATKLIAAGTKRPFGAREMPDSWRKTGARPRSKGPSVGALLCRVALFLGLAAGAVAGAVALGLIELPQRQSSSRSRGGARRPPQRIL
eukprot:PRCOL_00003489-RA